ncbi:MAG: hypothetical protein FWH52_03245, partial [Synergistaceae bacterium]|nr:hypothetical protein [Synergistaceae bacterium]
EESDTKDSSTEYKYVEFVKAGQRLYKISEKTTVTFTLNPTNMKVYTHAQMKNGDYIISIGIADVDVASLTEYGLPAQEGVASPRGLSVVAGTGPYMPLDIIETQVVGSMYDDLH